MSKKGKQVAVLLVIAVVVFGVIYGVVALTRNVGRNPSQVSEEKALQTLDKLYAKLSVNTPTPRKGYISVEGTNPQDELPEITKYPPVVEASTTLYAEIFSSPEKAGSGTDGWLAEVAAAFNLSGATVNGKPVSIRLRSISSGLAVDYISTGKYVPDAITPSNELWGEMLTAKGVSIELIEKRMAGNVAGVLFTKEKQKLLIEKYGAVDTKSIAQAVRAGELTMGYTNPLVSSTGLNYLLSTLVAIDPKDPLSDAATAAFEEFSANVPFVAYNTLQMRQAAFGGVLDGMVMEYQLYANMPEIQTEYTFTPFGTRHDSPLYAVGKISDEKKEIIKLFNEFCKDEKWNKLATNYGFNQNLNYSSDVLDGLDGKTIIKAQSLWKEKKNGGQPITAVFVADISGSMNGEPLNKLKESLVNGANYIGRDNYIGLVTFSDSSNVNIALPIGKFDVNQHAYLVGAVEDMQAGGNTAMYDAITVGAKMLVDAKEKNPNTKLLMFVLTDGERNMGLYYEDVKTMLQGLKIPIYTIGYRANIDVLQQISSLNEAASINADDQDVVYQLGNLFNAKM
ncbi:MAG: VWA domain-containing protein [Clostridium sp.]|jgi:Ca-activated chloride channel family protein|nr:VWA domain-containing protein [Clostridium sp.]